VLARIGAAHKKTAAQISLRYLVQQNIVVIPRTSKVERLTENAALFDFTLGDDEMAEIAALGRRDGRIVDWSYSGGAKWIRFGSAGHNFRPRSMCPNQVGTELFKCSQLGKICELLWP